MGRVAMQQNTHSVRLSERDAASFLGITQRTLQSWRLERRGPAYIKLGRRIAYDRADLEQFLTANRIEPTQAS